MDGGQLMDRKGDSLACSDKSQVFQGWNIFES